MLGRFIIGERIETSCTVSVSHCFESLGAYVELDDGLSPEPGDRVRVHGDPIHVAFGEVVRERRRATLVRAPWWERAWYRTTGDFEALELLDVSFTNERLS